MAPLLDDDTIPFGEEEQDKTNLRGINLLSVLSVLFNNLPHIISSIRHPYVTLFHIAFRGAAILSYMLCSWFSESFITTFVVIILLLSMDFWTVKNITGRLMVGLRWWNYIDDNGISHWVFESRKSLCSEVLPCLGEFAESDTPFRSQDILGSIIYFPILWVVFFLVAFLSFRFKWLLLVCIALAFNGANLYGYLKCKFGQGKEGLGSTLSSATSGFFRKQLIENMTSMMSQPGTSNQSTNNPNAQTNIV